MFQYNLYHGTMIIHVFFFPFSLCVTTDKYNGKHGNRNDSLWKLILPASVKRRTQLSKKDGQCSMRFRANHKQVMYIRFGDEHRCLKLVIFELIQDLYKGIYNYNKQYKKNVTRDTG